MIHLDLFSGLGLFSYAADHVFNLEHVFCEVDPWCRKFLKQTYPESEIHDDIKTFKAEEYRGSTFLLSAGFPCQPSSVAGKRAGTEDCRWLWEETIEATRRARPDWVIYENVAGLTSMVQQYSASEVGSKNIQRFEESDLFTKVFSQQKILLLGIIINDIEKAGYKLPELIDGTPVVLCVPAAGIGAPHRRDRIWIVAHRAKPGLPKSRSAGKREHETERRAWMDCRFKQQNCNAPNAEIPGLEGSDAKGRACSGRRDSEHAGEHFPGWQEPWVKVATRACRMDDGTAGRIHRTQRLKALGNAIVPQVAIMILRGIKEAHKIS